MAQMVKNPSAMQETWVQLLGQEDPLEKEMVTYSSILASFVKDKVSICAWIYLKPVHSKGDQPWVFFGRNDAKAETPILWPPHAKS